MSENFNSQSTNAEAQQIQEQRLINFSRLHTNRALIAYVSDQEKRNILLGSLPVSSKDLAQIEYRIAQYNMERVSRPPYVPNNPIVSENDPILDNIRSRPDIIQVFTSAGLDFRLVMIDLKQVLSFQPIIRIDNLDERIQISRQNDASLSQLCFPSNIQMEATYKIDERGYTITTTNPNFTYLPTQSSILAGTQTLPNFAFIPQINPGFLNVAHYQGRYFVRDGYHRAAGLLRNNTETQVVVPCILVEAQTLDQTGWRSGMLPEATLLSNHPPYVSDFWNEAMICDLIQKPKYRVLRMQIDTFEIDTF